MKNIEPPDVSRESDKFMLRLPDGMRLRISEVAKTNGRSMNAEIVARLQESFGHSNAASMGWLDLVQLLQTEAEKHGASISLTVAPNAGR